MTTRDTLLHIVNAYLDREETAEFMAEFDASGIELKAKDVPRMSNEQRETYEAAKKLIGKDLFAVVEQQERTIWNEAIEAAARNLETSYPGHKWVNAYCASIRSMRKPTP